MPYYAMRNGRKSGIFFSWSECEEQVKCFSGAEFKKFESLIDAEAFVGRPLDKDIKSENEPIFYVDGSFNSRTKRAGYGLVLLKDSKVIIKDLGTTHPHEVTSLQSVLGEIKGAIKAIDIAIANEYKNITIAYDYLGIEKWAKGQWKAKNEVIQYYQKVMKERMKYIKINFQKVKSHSNNKWNDEADRLAKIGSGVTR